MTPTWHQREKTIRRWLRELRARHPRWALAITLGLVYVVLMPLCLLTGDGRHPGASYSFHPDVVHVELESLLDQYFADPIPSDGKFKGKWLQVKAKRQNLSRHDNELVFASPGDGGPTTLKCRLSERTVRFYDSRWTNDSGESPEDVVVQGFCEGMIEGQVRLVQCEQVGVKLRN